MILVAKFFSGFSRLVSSGSFPNTPQDANKNIKTTTKTPNMSNFQNVLM